MAEEEEKRKTPRPLNNSLDEEFFKKLLASINTLFFFFFFSPTRVNSFLLTRCSTRCLLKPLNVSKFHALLNDPLNYHRKFDEKKKMKKKKKKKKKTVSLFEENRSIDRKHPCIEQPYSFISVHQKILTASNGIA